MHTKTIAIRGAMAKVVVWICVDGNLIESECVGDKDISRDHGMI